MAETRGKRGAYIVLFLFLGLGSWILIATVYAEAPLFVPRQCTNESLSEGCQPFDGVPEKYEIYAVLDVVVQAANIVPLIYVALHAKVGNNNRPPVIEIGVFFLLGVGAAIALAFNWEVTATIFGEEHSVVIILATFVGGAVGSMSMVTIWPFMSFFGQEYTSAMSAGIGLCGLVASGLALSQGVGQCIKFQAFAPYYPVADYFIAVGCIVLLAFASLVGIVLMRRRMGLRAALLGASSAGGEGEEDQSKQLVRHEGGGQEEGEEEESGEPHTSRMRSLSAGEGGIIPPITVPFADEEENKRFSSIVADENYVAMPNTPAKHTLPPFRRALGYAAAIIFTTCFLQYGSLGLTSYLFDATEEQYQCNLFLQTLTFNLGSILGRVVTAKLKTFKLHFVLLVQFAIFVYLYVFALLHQNGVFAPAALTIVLNCIFSIAHGYLFTMVFLRMRRDVEDDKVAKASRYCGLINQMGSLVGSVVTFLLIHLHVIF